jgi:hypothetical protein
MRLNEKVSGVENSSSYGRFLFSLRRDFFDKPWVVLVAFAFLAGGYATGYYSYEYRHRRED